MRVGSRRFHISPGNGASSNVGQPQAVRCVGMGHHQDLLSDN